MLLPDAVSVVYASRYYVLLKPTGKMASKSRTRRIVPLTWFVSFILASPYLYCKSYPFSIHSDLGSITRQICTDRFDEVDVWMFGKDHVDQVGGGQFRRGYFLFLFIGIYLAPLLLIGLTSFRMSTVLMRPFYGNAEASMGSISNNIFRKREENKRKVRDAKRRDEMCIQTLCIMT